MSNARLLADITNGDDAPVYACRAWVNFNGTLAMTVGSSYGPDAPPADYSSPNPIRASGNVSSITDNGTGDYTINFATAMPHSNYGIGLNAGYGAGGTGRYASAPDGGTTTITTTQLRLNTVYDYNQPQDCAWVTISIFC